MRDLNSRSRWRFEFRNEIGLKIQLFLYQLSVQKVKIKTILSTKIYGGSCKGYSIWFVSAKIILDISCRAYLILGYVRLC